MTPELNARANVDGDVLVNTTDLSAIRALGTQFLFDLSDPVPLPGEPTGGDSSVLFPTDVSADGKVTALDALIVINSLPDRLEGESAGAVIRGDVNRNGKVSAIEALNIINWLAGQRHRDAEAEPNRLAVQVDQVFTDDDEDLFETAVGGLF